MASDSLREVGKYIKKTREDVDHALDRYLQHRAKVERTRDTFSDVIPFVFYFKTEEDDVVTLELNFLLPPPTGNGLGGGDTGYNTVCESFTKAIGTHIISVEKPYLPTTVSVYVNGEEWDPNKWSEYDPSAGQVEVIVDATFTSNQVVICYLYTQV